MCRVTEKMIDIYKPNGVDWMGFKLSKNNPYTFHHIREERNGGERVIENGAILTQKAHQFLNYLEHHYSDAYDDYQELFKYINKTGQPITDDLLEDIYGMLLDIEYYHDYKENIGKRRHEEYLNDEELDIRDQRILRKKMKKKEKTLMRNPKRS